MGTPSSLPAVTERLRSVMSLRTQKILIGRPWPLLVLLIGGLFVVSSIPSVPGQFAWDVQIIEAGVRGSGATDLAIDSQGRPHVAYTDIGRGIVVYAAWTGAQWLVETAAEGGFPLGMVSLVLDERDLPHISYFDAQARSIRYANFDGFAWRLLTVDKSHFEGYSSITLGPDSIPYVAYASGNGVLMLGKLFGSNWTLETVDREVVVARYPSLAFNAEGRGQIAYYGNGVLLHAEWNGFRWDVKVVDGEDSPQFVNMVLDATDVPKIGYRNNVHREVRFAWRENGTWQWEVVDSDGDTGWDTGFALDRMGNPHISYYDRERALLKYAYRLQGTWFVRIVDQVGVVGWYSSVAVGDDARPHFSYFSWTDATMRYALGDFDLGIRTWNARDVTPTTALLVGEVTALGDADQLEVSFEYRALGGNWTPHGKTSVAVLGFVTAPLEDLIPERQYEYRVVGVAEGIVVRGDVLPFTTPPVPPPEPVLSLPALLAIAGGLIGAILVAYGFVQWRKRVRETPKVERPTGLYGPKDSGEGGKKP